jgi:quercetin dioxygenase-like cupin family protein
MTYESVVERISPTHFFTYDGATLSIFHANKGQGLPKHDHNFAHATMCMAGSCWIRKEGKEVLINKNTQPFNLVANEWHEIEAAEDGTVFCNLFAEGKY